MISCHHIEIDHKIGRDRTLILDEKKSYYKRLIINDSYQKTKPYS